MRRFLLAALLAAALASSADGQTVQLIVNSGNVTGGGGCTVSPSIDGSAAISGLNVFSIALTVPTNGDLVLFGAKSFGSGGAWSVTSVTDTGGLTWTQRANVVYQTNDRVIEYYAIAPTSGSRTITLAVSGSTASVRVFAVAVKNINASTPFDPDASLPRTFSGNTDGSGNIAIGAYSTTSSHDLLVSAFSDNGTGTVPSGFTTLGTIGTGAQWASEQVTSTQSSVTTSWTGLAAGTPAGGWLDALQCGS